MQRFCVAVTTVTWRIIELASLGGRMMFYLGMQIALSDVEYPCTDELLLPNVQGYAGTVKANGCPFDIN